VVREFLTHHEVATAFERGWSKLTNGELIDAAENDGFEILVTIDQNLRYQQNLTSRHIAIVVLSTTSWPRIQRAIAGVVRAINSASEGTLREVEIA